MKVKSIIYGIVALTIISSCGVPQADHDKLIAENERLKMELDEYKFGAKRIVAVVEKSYAEKDYSLARRNIELLYEKYPESNKNAEFKELLKTIEREAAIEKKRKEAEKKEQVILANLNNTGMWSLRFFVDDFGEPTKGGYITNTKFIQGAFSNTATQDSALNVRFVITKVPGISILLYEYAKNNPVKASSPDSYTVLVQDKDGNRLKLKAVNYSERLTFEKAASEKIHDALLKGGSLMFRITEKDRPTTQYNFSIQKADWYGNAYEKLTGS